MYYLYYLKNNQKDIYVGISSNPKLRFNSHRHKAKRGSDLPLYVCMRKHHMYLVTQDFLFYNKKDAYLAECNAISRLRKDINNNVLNVADGGLGGYVVPKHKKDVWRAKLSKARQGQQPALGMKHTEENKKLFSAVATKYWEENRKYHYDDIKHLSYKEARELLAISKTRYYRLLKQTKANDLS